jgi:regulator of replication initiation timing
MEQKEQKARTPMAQATKSSPGLDSIDRLEEKIKLLVNTIGRIKGEQNRVAEENGRLKAEIESLKGRISSAESTGVEVTSLREERDMIKARVTEMLKQLDGLNL